MNEILSLMSPSDKERYWAKVNVGSPDVCWEWKAGRNNDGYGNFALGTKKTPFRRMAHRVAFALSTGLEIQDGLVVMHKCDNPCCCNPNHLQTGTHQENMNDMKDKGRSPLSFGGAKLSWEIVDEMRSSGLTGAEIVRKYGVAKSTASMILNRKTWNEEVRHVAKGLS